MILDGDVVGSFVDMSVADFIVVVNVDIDSVGDDVGDFIVSHLLVADSGDVEVLGAAEVLRDAEVLEVAVEVIVKRG